MKKELHLRAHVLADPATKPKIWNYRVRKIRNSLQYHIGQELNQTDVILLIVDEYWDLWISG